MPRFVIDSSVVIKWFLAEPHGDLADEILDAFESKQLQLVVPDILYAELPMCSGRGIDSPALIATIASCIWTISKS